MAVQDRLGHRRPAHHVSRSRWQTVRGGAGWRRRLGGRGGGRGPRHARRHVSARLRQRHRRPPGRDIEGRHALHLWPAMRAAILLVGLGFLAVLTPRATATAALRVCADPNNLPFSNQRGEGFENRLAQMLAREMGTHVEYVWRAQRRGFLRETLNAGACDVVMGYAAGAGPAQTTTPYYRSTYVFVTRTSRHLAIDSFDAAELRRLRIGVQVIGDDGVNSPPAHALSRRGLAANLVGCSVYGDY